MTAKAIIVSITYLVASILFIIGLARLSKVRTARSGNAIAWVGMLLAMLATLVHLGRIDYRWILIGLVVGSVIGAISAMKVAMTSMPEMVALFNGFGGAASTLVALSVFWLHLVEPKINLVPVHVLSTTPAVTVVLSVLIGGVTFSGSMIAFMKLNGQMTGNPILIPARHFINVILALAIIGVGMWAVFGVADASLNAYILIGLTVAALLLGVLLVIPIGGADMPVVISLLNSYSGMAASATGFVLGNNLLIIAGALVGSSGIILSQIMCKAMNRSLANVLFGGFGGEQTGTAGGGEYTNVRSVDAEEASMILEAAQSCIIVPGYGLAVAQAQHACKELGETLEKRGCTVRYAIHPVAGRMPGHMNVLLAEADVDYEKLVEMDEINPDFSNTDAVIVVGANDVVNPVAETTPGSPIYGMPILKVHHAKTVFVIKRSLSPGFAGIKNELFDMPNCLMVFGDAKKVLRELNGELQEVAKAA